MSLTEQEVAEKIKDVAANAKSWAVKGLLVLVALVLLNGSFGYNDSGMATRVQMPLIGHTWITEEGFYGKMPLVSRVREYPKDITVAVTDNESTIDTASISEPPRILQFADTYKVRMEYSMRFRLPTVDTDLETMHQSVKSNDNLLGNTLMPFALTLAGDTANQMLAADFSQGGKNAFRNRMADQAENGMLSTVVRQEEVFQETADTDSDRDPGTTKRAKQFVKKVVILKDKDGRDIRIPTAIAAYGIKVVPNSLNIIESTPVERLVEFIAKKQKNLALQIDQQELQVLERGKAKTKQLEGARSLIERTNVLNIAKAEAIITMQKEVEQATLQAEKENVERQKVADLAVIDKTRELQIAKANEGIQKANAVAARYEANAIKEVGFAKVAVEKARLAAKESNKAIYLAELQLEETKALAEVLPHVKLDMPDTVIGSSSGVNGLDTNLMNLGMLKSAVGISPVK